MGLGYNNYTTIEDSLDYHLNKLGGNFSNIYSAMFKHLVLLGKTPEKLVECTKISDITIEVRNKSL